MRSFFQVIGATVGVLLAVCVIAALSFGLYTVLAPAYVGVQNRVFHQSQPYNDGMVNQLEQFREAYATATSVQQRSALRSIVLEQYASYPEQRLNPDLREFLDKLKEMP